MPYKTLKPCLPIGLVVFHRVTLPHVANKLLTNHLGEEPFTPWTFFFLVQRIRANRL